MTDQLKAAHVLAGALRDFAEAFGTTIAPTATMTKPKSKAAPKAVSNGAAKATAAPKTKEPSTLKEHAEAALAAKKFRQGSKNAEFLQEYVTTKVDLRSAEGRAMSTQVAELLGLPAPKRPGPSKKAEKPAKAAKAAKVEKPAKAAKPPKEKKVKAAKAGGTLKDQVKAALSGDQKFTPKQKAALEAFVASKADGRSQEAREAAVEVCSILGLPAPKRPGPAPKAEKKVKEKKAKATSGKGEADTAPEASQPSPTNQSPDAPKSRATDSTKPRAIDAVETVIGTGTLNADGVLKALEEKGWVPASTDPKTYISFILSQNKDKFERDPSKPRGYYRLVGSEGTSTSTPAAAAPETPETPAEKPAKVKANGFNGLMPVETVAAETTPTADTASTPTEEDLPPAEDDDENPFDDSILS